MSFRGLFREQYWSSSDGLRLYSRVYDTAQHEAPAVLCLAGLTRNSRDFETLAPHLAARYRVICPDLRGRGGSQHDPNWCNYQPAVYLQDLQGLFTVLELERVAIIGTSLGGLLAMLLAAADPQRIVGVVLNDIGPEVDPRGLERIKRYTGQLPPVRTWQRALEQLREVYGCAWPDLSDEAWSGLVRRSYRADASGEPVLDVDPAIGEALRAASPAADHLWPVFASLGSLPMLVIRGALSDILSERTLARMRRDKPGLAHVTVENRGHVPLLDEPAALAAIDRFLGELPRVR